MQSNFTFQWQFEHIHKHTQKEKKNGPKQPWNKWEFFFPMSFQIGPDNKAKVKIFSMRIDNNCIKQPKKKKLQPLHSKWPKLYI